MDEIRSSTLHVCTSCRTSGSPREPQKNRDGFKLYHALHSLLSDNPLGQQIEIKPAECLSLCPPPCAIALSSSGAWCYLFGGQHPDKSARDIIDCLSLYLKTKDGFMSREQRPVSLRSSILGRIPPEIFNADAQDSKTCESKY